MPLVSRTRATFRSAEFGFFGVWVNTRTHTPRFCGLFCSAGLLVLLTIFVRPFRTSWLIVGTGEKLHAAAPRSQNRPRARHPRAGPNVASGLEAQKAWRPMQLPYSCIKPRARRSAPACGNRIGA